jgi:hypothetical protein
MPASRGQRQDELPANPPGHPGRHAATDGDALGAVELAQPAWPAGRRSAEPPHGHSRSIHDEAGEVLAQRLRQCQPVVQLGPAATTA